MQSLEKFCQVFSAFFQFFTFFEACQNAAEKSWTQFFYILALVKGIYEGVNFSKDHPLIRPISPSHRNQQVMFSVNQLLDGCMIRK